MDGAGIAAAKAELDADITNPRVSPDTRQAAQTAKVALEAYERVRDARRPSTGGTPLVRPKVPGR